jgi:hypothetical protein
MSHSGGAHFAVFALMTFANRLRRAFFAVAALVVLAGCGDDDGHGGVVAGAAGQATEGGASAGDGGTGGGGEAAQGGTGEGGDVGQGNAGQGAEAGAGGQAGSVSGDCIEPDAPFEWPVPLEDVSVPAHDSWKTELTLPEEPFLSVPDNFSPDAIRWVKFTVLLSEPETVYFQDSTAYSFHYEFASEHIPEFEGMTRQEFDAVTLSTAGQRAILGAVLVPGDSLRYPEYAVQLVVNDAMHPELARRIVESVQASVHVSEPRRTLYFPNPAQMLCAPEHESFFAEHDLPIGSVDRWLVGDACYAPGWAIGRLVKLAASEVAEAYLDGSLRPEDILLLTDPAPAELPFVAGVLTLAPSTPNSHSAILARSYGVPFAYLRREEAAARAEALVGKQVVVSTKVELSSGDCAVRFIDVDALSAVERAEIEALSVPPPIELAPKRASGAFTISTEGLLPTDIDRVGGKAAHFGVLAAGSPDFVPTPSFAISFDAWDAFMDQPAPDGAAGTLRDEIARRLEPFAWPADLAALATALDGVVELIRDAEVPAEVQAAVEEALEPFDPMVRIRFRSSTNVEDSATFTGAGLYDSATGCFADNLDEDSAGPSLCNPEETSERGVFRAIKRVYSSFYAQNAYFQRLRRGVKEEDVAMGVLVHYSVPDPTELANGVATLTVESPESRKVDLVTQLGAVSVTNPDGSARPETVRVERYETSDYLQTVEWSSLVALGDHVLSWESDYRTLMDELNAVADEYARVTGRSPPFSLDFEYKKIEGSGLSLRQVRPLPTPDTTEDVTPYLVGEPAMLCVLPGEVSDVFAMHRLKARIGLETSHGPLTPSILSERLYDSIAVEYLSASETAELSGDPASFPGAAHAYADRTVTDAWTASGGTWMLSTTVPEAMARNVSPVVVPADFGFGLSVQWSNPVPYLDWLDGPQTRTEDSISLWTSCPDTSVLEAGSMRIERNYAAPNGVTVATAYWFPPPPRGFTAGYTAPIVKWEETTITGLASTPIVLRGYYSQTHRPAHHNFGGDYIFEPGLEPGIAATVLDELEAQDIRYLVVVDIDSPTDNRYWIAGLDGSLRQLLAP